MAEAKLVHELDHQTRSLAVAAYAAAHGSAPNLGFAPDRAWIEGYCFAAPTQAQEDARDAERYRRIRNGPHSDRYGDVYAMTFQGDGDLPVKGDELDRVADAARAAQGGAA